MSRILYALQLLAALAILASVLAVGYLAMTHVPVGIIALGVVLVATR